MVTRTVGLIGSGRNHATIQEALDWFNGYNFTGTGVNYIDIYNEGGGTDGEWTVNAGLTGPTGTTNASATDYLHIRAAPGTSFMDHANKRTNRLGYNPAAGTAILNTSTAIQMNIAVNYTRITGLQFRCSSVTPSQMIGTIGGGVVLNTIIANNIFRGNGGAAWGNASFGQHKFWNNAIFNARLAMAGDGAANESVVANTVYLPTGSAVSAIDVQWGAIGCFDNLFFSTDAADATFGNGGNMGGGSSNNADSDGTTPATGRYTITAIGDLFENLTAGTEDLRVKASAPSAFKTGGVRRATETGDLDITGFARSITTPTIGAWEAGSAFKPQICQTPNGAVMRGITP